MEVTAEQADGRAGSPEEAHLAMEAWLVVRYTRHWLHYGVIGFAVVCTVVAALKGMAVP